jgi:hypothetical protein
LTLLSGTNRQPNWLIGALAGALPPIWSTLAGAVAWGAAMGASALLVLALAHWETPQKMRMVVAVFAAGGALGFPFGLILARFLSHRRGRETAFAAAFLSLAAMTVCATAGIFALDYRAYYAEWHEDPLTRIWFFQFAFTVAAAFYQFAALGLRLYFPIGFIALAIVSIWFARSVR